MSATPPTTPDTEQPAASKRRWPRRLLIGSLLVLAMLAAAFWLLGRETTLQQLVQRIANASGGQITVSDVSGSLYHRMHIGHLVYRSEDSVITAEQIDINWSPLQYFSAGLSVSELRVAALTVQSLKESPPPTLPASLALPFELHLADARIELLTLIGTNAGSKDVIRKLHLQLDAGPQRWQLHQASASTAYGDIGAELKLDATAPFALQGRATLAHASGASVRLDASGTLAALKLQAQASLQNNSTAGTASANAVLAPFDSFPLRSLNLQARSINPAALQASLPQALLDVDLQASLDTQQQLSGRLSLHNRGKVGAIDQQALPLQALAARLNGSLKDRLNTASLDDVVIDLGAAGRFTGGGKLQHKDDAATLESAQFTLHTDKLNLRQLHSSLHATSLAGDINLQGKAKQQTLTARLTQKDLQLDLQALLNASKLHLQQARLQARQGSLAVTGQASLQGQRDFTLTLRSQHFDPAALGPQLPVADLNGSISVDGKLAPAWQASATLDLQASKLAGHPLTASGKLRADARHLSDVDLRMQLAQNSASIKGSFGAAGEQLRWLVEAPQLNAFSSDIGGAANVSGTISGSMAAPRSSFELDARGLMLSASKHPNPDGRVHASGELTLAGASKRPELNVQGTLQKLDPAAFGSAQGGSIQADFRADARLAQDWRAALSLTLQSSTLGSAPLSGRATLQADRQRISNADIDLHLASMALSAKGSFGKAGDKLEWKLAAPQLAPLGPQFGGALQAAGILAGTSAKPALSFTLDGSNLHLPGARQIASIRGSATLGSTESTSDVPMVADIDISRYGSPALSLNRLRLQTSGSRSAHTLQLSASNGDFDASVKLAGSWANDSWSGTLNTLQNRGRFAFTLAAPATLKVTAERDSGVAGLLHPQQISVGNASLQLPDGSIRLDQLEKNGASWRSKGQAQGVPVNYLAQLSPAWHDFVRSTLTIGAEWSLNLQAASNGAAPVLDGMLRVYREAGDLTITGADLPQALGLRMLDARADLTDGNLRLQLNLDGSRAGQARFDASTRLVDGHLSQHSPFTLSGSANMGSIAWLAPLAGQPGMEVDGVLKLNVAGSGSFAAPQLNGDLNGEKLMLTLPEQGIKLRNGQLQARISGDQLSLQNLSFDGTEGRASAEGWMRYADNQASMNLKLVADKLEVLARPDRILVVSGSSSLTRDAKQFQLTGKYRAERASIELADENTPTLSDDVIILGRGTAVGKTPQGMPLNIDLEADLGDAFSLKGKGLNAQLAGTLRIRVSERRAPRVQGSIRVVSGTYAAYGKQLSIERGVINFSGAYDNPGLNILAVRHGPEGEALSETNVEAGVEVRGTALAPVAKLVSTPNVSDSDKLAWLVLGHGIDSTGGNDMALLSTAAGALFGGGQGRLANALGVDELGVKQAAGTAAGSATGLQSTVVTVGKRLSARAYLSFEQGAGTATSLVKLKYKLNPRITLQFQTGTNNALDVLYNWAFD
ncbi:translocation/assembly module TamB domain-containing protein [Pseudoduganella danionis]|uniref:translocation/assembly module TamB domain-containing protein n=1 Tax=Pseudoduganella danionis TaxID=1890295 RepID=UPI0035AEE6B0